MTEYDLEVGERVYDDMFPNGITIVEVLGGEHSHWRVEDRDDTVRTHMTLGKAYDDANKRARNVTGRAVVA